AASGRAHADLREEDFLAAALDPVDFLSSDAAFLGAAFCPVAFFEEVDFAVDDPDVLFAFDDPLAEDFAGALLPDDPPPRLFSTLRRSASMRSSTSPPPSPSSDWPKVASVSSASPCSSFASMSSRSCSWYSSVNCEGSKSASKDSTRRSEAHTSE